ncbi:hypothetical protein SAICODRAFT_37691 [Saitoella complicata NRRL Y-17804]|uniref:uncharacterized protein n=1 Tax=Saitoella complicata (strain BCRC 22490 / CBS 7301 / JCM 7358 / NBRC 10748 / NRRL Y-17804) TaxID=698492 RepID=UPI0008670369|nr:uncharacterized protein SAICODRAFT_37691 [Saitoella complicata NRRL Y-17804]ODQ49674.1 hypothetical protein SAICODRAFT_37691 [Saitoella complicata NRRL Y-17804]
MAIPHAGAGGTSSITPTIFPHTAPKTPLPPPGPPLAFAVSRPPIVRSLPKPLTNPIPPPQTVQIRTIQIRPGNAPKDFWVVEVGFAHCEADEGCFCFLFGGG